MTSGAEPGTSREQIIRALGRHRENALSASVSERSGVIEDTIISGLVEEDH